MSVLHKFQILELFRFRISRLGMLNMYNKKQPTKILRIGLGMVAHTCNPSYSGGGGRRIMV
jgi:hypothetical protein